MPKDSKTFWDKSQERIKALSKQVITYAGEFVTERKKAQAELSQRKRETKARIIERIAENENGHSLPENAKFEVVRPIPRGIKVLRSEPGLVQLRFFANRSIGFKTLLAGIAVVIGVCVVAATALNPYNPAPTVIQTVIVFIPLYLYIMRPRVVVTVTEDWLQFGSKFYEMANVSGITLGGNLDGSLNISETSNVQDVYRVRYGRWGEKTIYMASNSIINSHTLFMNSIIDQMRSDDKHASEAGQREQKF